MTSKASRRHSGFTLIELLIVITIIGIIAAIAVPYLINAQQDARGGSAIQSLRQLHTAEASYRNIEGSYASLSDLTSANYINDSNLASGQKSGYIFAANPGPDPTSTYSATADPIASTHIWLHYYVDQTGVIRSEAGAPATASSSPLN